MTRLDLELNTIVVQNVLRLVQVLALTVVIIKLPTEGLGTLISNLNNNKLYYSTKSSYDSQRDLSREAKVFLFSNKMSLRKPTT